MREIGCVELDEILKDVAVLWMEERSEARDEGGGGGIRREVAVATEEDEGDREMGEPGVDLGPAMEEREGGGDLRGVCLGTEEGRWGSFGGTAFRFAIAFSQSRVIILSVAGLASEEVDTSS